MIPLKIPWVETPTRLLPLGTFENSGEIMASGQHLAWSHSTPFFLWDFHGFLDRCDHIAS